MKNSENSEPEPLQEYPDHSTFNPSIKTEAEAIATIYIHPKQLPAIFDLKLMHLQLETPAPKVMKDFHHEGRSIEDGASVNEGGRSRSNDDVDISGLAMKKESETVDKATQPPPEPPDPTSIAAVRVEATWRREEGRTEAVPGSHSGAADGFLVQGKRRTLMAHVDGDATVTDESLRTRLLRRSFLLSPPPLLAAVFPWERGGGQHSTSGEGRAVATGEPAAMTSGLLKDAAETIAGRPLSLSYFRNGANGGKEGTAAAAGTHPKASGGRCGPGSTVVELAEAWWKHEVGGNILHGGSLVFRHERQDKSFVTTRFDHDRRIGTWFLASLINNFHRTNR
ncbi:hypothetical protein PIB30_076342 [Stylosanthes scabra]|uniref:Uncharacterized protein n=1 Tax=Stylosanthes scabra TaxID=79078 RepID=A0ABU6SRG5_9FABA|nr:hypothetical protein [Stylosanthes scabra]